MVHNVSDGVMLQSRSRLSRSTTCPYLPLSVSPIALCARHGGLPQGPICEVCSSASPAPPADHAAIFLGHHVHRYFSVASELAMDSWSTADEGAEDPCGHCDNCTRSQETVDRRDVRLAAWQILQVLQAAKGQKCDLSVNQLADLVRGSGSSSSGKTVKGAGKLAIDVDAVAGGKMKYSKAETELLCIHLLANGYLQPRLKATAYTTNVYVELGKSAGRLTRFSREQVEQDGPVLFCCFPSKGKTKATPAGKSQEKGKRRQTNGVGRKGKKRARASGTESDVPGDGDGDFQEEMDDIPVVLAKRSRPTVTDSDYEDDIEDDDWTFSMVPKRSPSGRVRKKSARSPPDKSGEPFEDVICILSSD